MLHFSNPNRTYNGAVTGVSQAQDNTMSLNNVRSTIANFRQSVGTEPPPAEPDLTVESGSARHTEPDRGRRRRATGRSRRPRCGGGPGSGSTTAEYKLSAVVRNIGNAATPSNQSVTVSIKVDGIMVDTEVFSNLAAGASVSVQTSSPWQAVAGTKTLAVLADDPNQVAESNESNNSRSLSFTVAEPPPPPEPDLIVKSVALVGSNLVDGDNVYVSAVVQNVGDAATPSNQSVTVSVKVNGSMVDTEAFANLAAGASVSIQTSICWRCSDSRRGRPPRAPKH